MLRTAACCALAALLGSPAAVFAQSLRAEAATPIRFGVLPIGGAVESRTHWTPLLDELGRAIGRPVSMLSLTSYESLDRAIQRNEVDLALLPGKLALDAVMQRRMTVLAQVPGTRARPSIVPCCWHARPARRWPTCSRSRSAGGWRAATPARCRASWCRSSSSSCRAASRWKRASRARSSTRSRARRSRWPTAMRTSPPTTPPTSGDSGSSFRSEAERLQIIWRSEPTPPALFVVRRDHPAALQKRLQAFLEDYGRAKGPRGDAEREVLKSLHAALGYEAADNTALLPAAALDYQLAKQRALSARWVNEAARRARLERIEKSYAEQATMLRGGF